GTNCPCDMARKSRTQVSGKVIETGETAKGMPLSQSKSAVQTAVGRLAMLADPPTAGVDQREHAEPRRFILQKSMMRSGSMNGGSVQDEREYAECADFHQGEFSVGKRRMERRVANQLFRIMFAGRALVQRTVCGRRAHMRSNIPIVTSANA